MREEFLAASCAWSEEEAVFWRLTSGPSGSECGIVSIGRGSLMALLFARPGV
jgi:hypothetical protein